MPNFRYQVIDAAGKKSEGLIEAASIGEATRKLKTDGKYISSLTLDRGSDLANINIGSPMLKTKDLVPTRRSLWLLPWLPFSRRPPQRGRWRPRL